MTKSTAGVPPFVLGDVVKCVVDCEQLKCEQLKRDGLYTISKIVPRNEFSGPWFVEVNDQLGFFLADRFERLTLWERIAVDRAKAKREKTLTWEVLQEFEPQPWRNDKPQMHFPDGDTEADPRDKEPFDVGDRVTCVDDSTAIGLCCGDEYVVSLVRAHSMHGRWLVELEDTDSRYYASRFKLVETPAPAFKKGDIVECIAGCEFVGFHLPLREGQLYKVESVFGNIIYVKIGGLIRDYSAYRFKLYDVEENNGTYHISGDPAIILNAIHEANERPYAAGDIVKCVNTNCNILSITDIKSGRYYRVGTIIDTKSGWMVTVDLGGGEDSLSYFAYRFQPLEGEERVRLSSLFKEEYPI